MNEGFLNNLSPQQVAERFDLLAADAKEYAIFLLGQEGRLICWNPGAERLFGYHSSEIIGQHFSRFFSPEDIRNGQPEHELKTALTDGRADSVRWQVRKDGTRFWCRATVTPLRDEHKQVRSFARVMHDLTDSQAQDAQKKRADDLAAANRSKEEFMALLSHELRNPLSPILNALNILRQMRTNDPIIEQAGNIIDRQVVQMVRLVDDLLDISRITKGKLRLTKEKVELRVVANRAAEAARPLMDARKHDFSVSLPTQPVWVEADPARLEQIVVNLLNNAAKYTDSGGLVRMRVYQEGAEAVIRVRDNGIGIALEMLPRIFDLFTQADGALSRSHGGLGIGLALVRTLVEMQEGRVQAQSGGLGEGSEFTVKLNATQPGPGPRKWTFGFEDSGWEDREWSFIRGRNPFLAPGFSIWPLCKSLTE
jgi:PAS domain S-box-containing protein